MTELKELIKTLKISEPKFIFRTNSLEQIVVSFEDFEALLIALNENSGILSAKVASLNHELPNFLMLKILQGQYLYNATQGATLSVNEDLSELVLQKVIKFEKLNIKDFAQNLRDFFKTLKKWQEIIQKNLEPSQNFDPNLLNILQI